MGIVKITALTAEQKQQYANLKCEAETMEVAACQARKNLTAYLDSLAGDHRFAKRDYMVRDVSIADDCVVVTERGIYDYS